MSREKRVAAALAAAARAGDLGGRLGLGLPALDDVGPARRLAVSRPDGPAELFAFRAGWKPVALLTVTAGEAGRVAALFGDAHVERRERRVAIGAQDAWRDRRDEGDPRIELYIARDAALAGRAAELQERDPSAALEELGALMGYPDCCVRAFAAQDDRSNNSANRYAAVGRTLDGGAAEPWAWELNDLFLHVVPFFPCRYDCPAALDLARRSLAEMERARAGATAAARVSLAAPVLYFDHDHQLVLDGEARAGRVRYRTVRVAAGPDPFARFAGLLARGDALELQDDALHITREGHALFRFERRDGALGLVAPFA